MMGTGPNEAFLYKAGDLGLELPELGLGESVYAAPVRLRTFVELYMDLRPAFGW